MIDYWVQFTETRYETSPPHEPLSVIVPEAYRDRIDPRPLLLAEA